MKIKDDNRINNLVRKTEIENHLANCDKHFRNLRIRAFLALAVLVNSLEYYLSN